MYEHTILLVDDEPQLLEVNRETLESQGYGVLTAKNGLEALKVLGATEVDLVVSDLRMPKLGGQDLLMEMRSRGYGADIIFLTGYGTVENAVECIRLGAADYLLKPFNIRQLLSKIESVLENRDVDAPNDIPDTLPAMADNGDLSRLLDLGNALSSQRDFKSLVKELLLQVREAFGPEGMALYLPEAMQDGPRIAWGPLLRGDHSLVGWLSGQAEEVLSSGQSRLVGPLEVPSDGMPREVSVMLAPMGSNGGTAGIVAVLRSSRKISYSNPSLQLLTVFASQAAGAMESLKNSRRLQDMNLEIISSHVNAVEAKDIYTRGHSERVGAYAALLGREMGLTTSECDLLSYSGILHDIGKIGVPDVILNKPEKLSDEEYNVMKQHPVLGRDILSGVRTLRDVLPIIYHHHEKWDGTGYPDCLAGEKIPFHSRIISVIDGFEAMTSDRAYQKARSTATAAKILSQGAGTQWDPTVVKAWLEVLAHCDVTTAFPELPPVSTHLL